MSLYDHAMKVNLSNWKNVAQWGNTESRLFKTPETMGATLRPVRFKCHFPRVDLKA